MLLYRVFVWLYPKIALVLGLANKRARLWYLGRRGLFKKLAATFLKNDQPVIWIHTASLGEFEQGLPVIQSLKEKFSGYKILVTFFSPSGYEVRKDHPAPDHIFYLPMDTPANATRFFNIVQPSLILFIKYEFWYYYLSEAKLRNIPLLLVSGIFRPNQLFFRWYGAFYRSMLKQFSYLLVQNTESVELLTSIGIRDNVFKCGDTRFDRVIDIAHRFEPNRAIDHFCRGRTTIVAGSTWTEDDEELDHFANTNPAVKFIIAPHDISTERLKECLGLYEHSMLYSHYLSELEAGNQTDEQINVLILDNVGMLSKLYHYATICYVGGGFGDDGIHNILEPAVFGKPVVFGPVYEKYFEASELLDAGGAFSINNALELDDLFRELLSNAVKSEKSGKASEAYVRNNAGASTQVIRCIQEKRLLTK